jgi:hypothetical protein
MCGVSACQPGPQGRFLMGPAAWAERQKPLQAGKTGPESGVGPAPEDLLPDRLEA